MSRPREEQVQAILQALNAAGWHVEVQHAEPRAAVFIARHRQTGEEFVSRAPAVHALDAARYLAQRRGMPLEDEES